MCQKSARPNCYVPWFNTTTCIFNSVDKVHSVANNEIRVLVSILSIVSPCVVRNQLPYQITESINYTKQGELEKEMDAVLYFCEELYNREILFPTIGTRPEMFWEVEKSQPVLY